MVAPSFLAETCTPSSFWPEAEVIEPVSNWSAEAVLAAPTRTTLATLANNWHRIFVMVFFSSSRGCGGLARSTGAERHDRPLSLSRESCGQQRGSQSKHGRSGPEAAHAEPQVFSNNYEPAILLCRF